MLVLALALGITKPKVQGPKRGPRGPYKPRKPKTQAYDPRFVLGMAPSMPWANGMSFDHPSAAPPAHRNMHRNLQRTRRYMNMSARG